MRSFSVPVLAFCSLVAPAFAQVNPDACKQVPVDDVAALVTLNQSTVEENVRTDMNRCDWDVKTPLSFMGGEVRLTIQHFDTHKDAVDSLRQESPLTFDKEPALVKTSGPDDHVRSDNTNTAEYARSEAVHGEYLAKVEVLRTEPGARAHPTFAYRLQRLALQAAGATILPTIGLPPDPVRPKAVPDTADGSSHAGSGSLFSQPPVIVLIVLAVLVLGAALRRVVQRKG
ncbi:hypothetical protein [Terriglobus sp.]|uniref:hypothetical protein n=1 Tax=Terriglobus sp. TaxID=1889013 RepID=UPI003B00D07F